MRRFLTSLVLIAMLASSMLAQSFYGSIVGTVTDTSGAAVPGAKVTLSSKGTADTRTVQSDASGNYQFVSLVPGSYEVNIEATGFKRLTRSNVQVEVAGAVRVDASMQVGDVSESVEVSSQASLLQTEASSVSQAVTGRTVTEMPLNGRNVMNLMSLSTGVVPGTSFQGNALMDQVSATSATTNPPAFGSYYAGGGMPNTGGNFIDGSPVTVGFIHSTALIITQDAVQEFRVQVNNVEPEFGQAANGVVSFTTKSGTNQYHGTLYEFLRNRVLNANTFFGNSAGLPTPKFIQNQYGGALGGPVKKDKLFFFFSYEGFRQEQQRTLTYTLPTVTERAGDLSNYRSASGALIAIYDPSTSIPRTPFPGNKIPATRLSNSAQIFLKYFALPNSAGAPFTSINNFNTNALFQGNSNQFNFRSDYNMSEKQRVFLRFTHWQLNQPRVDPQQTGAGSKFDETIHNAVVGDSYSLSPTTILDVRLSYTRLFFDVLNHQLGVDFTSLGWPSFYNSQIELPVPPQMSIQGFTVSGSGGGQHNESIADDDAVSGSVTKVMGRHTLKFGGEFRRMPNSWREPTAVVGSTANQFTFNNLFTSINPTSPAGTGAGIASYLLGLGSGGALLNYMFSAQEQRYAGAFAGDTFKVTQKLTLNLGVRWEYPGYWSERFNRAAVFEPNAVNPVVQSLGLPYQGDIVLVASARYPGRTTQNPSYKLFSPRVGLAWHATSNTVIRAGFGTAFLPNDVLRDESPIGSPVSMTPTFWNTTTDGSVTAAATLDNPFPNGFNQPVQRNPNFETLLLGNRAVAQIPNQPSAYMAQWNFGIERQIGDGSMIGVSWVGSRGIHLPAGLTGTTALGYSIDQIPDQYLSLGSQLLQQVKNPFYGIVKTGTLSNPTIPYGQLLTPFPQYAGAYSSSSGPFDSVYQSLQAKFEKRIKGGGNLLVSYTWSKNLGTGDNISSFTEQGYTLGTIQDLNNFRGSRSELSYDVPQRLVFSYVYDLPLGKGKKFLNTANGIADKIISGWGLDGVASFQSGYPLALQAQPSAINSQFYGGTTRPNVISGCNKVVSGSSQSRITGWFNTACFSQPGQFAFGSESRTDPNLRTSGVDNFDFSLFKTTAIREQVKLQFRAEVFNLANRVQFASPGTTLGTAQFGIVSGQQNLPRLIQLALRLTF